MQQNSINTHKRTRQRNTFENVEQHHGTADNDQKIRLHVEARLDSDKKRLKVQIRKVIENNDVEQPSKAKETGKIRQALLFGTRGGTLCFCFSESHASVQIHDVHHPGEYSDESSVAQRVFHV